MPEGRGDDIPRGGSPDPPRPDAARGGCGDPPRDEQQQPQPRRDSSLAPLAQNDSVGRAQKDSVGRTGATVEADGLHFAYVRGEAVLAGLSMRADAGRLTCVLGPNGSGKTTLLRLLAGLARPGAGEVRLAGRPLASYRRADLARRVAYVPQ